MILPAGKVSRLVNDLKKRRSKIVLVGGCFDVLHPGHVFFLQKAKKAGDILLVLLESDQKVKKLKGPNRPVQTQQARAQILSSLKSVDCVITLPFWENEQSYDQLILKIKPDIIAVTKGEQDLTHHQRAAQISGAKIKFVTKMIGNYSTTGILKIRD